MKTNANRPTRRTFLRDCISLGIGSMLPQIGRHTAENDAYTGLKSGKYLGKIRVDTWIKEDQVFTEGPAVDRQGNVFFTNIPTNRILKWNTSQRELSIIDAMSQATNGLRFDTSGRLLACRGATGQVVRMDLDSGEEEILAESFQGKKLQSPNDLEIDSKGRIYFSSRMSNADLDDFNEIAVYRIDPNGDLVQLLKAPEVDMPNGLVISPNQKILYLIEAHPAADHNRKIIAFDLDAEGNVSNQRTHYDFYPGRSGDGMCIDANGNLYVAAGLHQTRNTSETLDTQPGIHVISPEGKLVAYRPTPIDTITNCTFGGKDLRTLYITCGAYLLKARTKIPGKKSYLPSR